MINPQTFEGLKIAEAEGWVESEVVKGFVYQLLTVATQEISSGTNIQPQGTGRN